MNILAWNSCYRKTRFVWFTRIFQSGSWIIAEISEIGMFDVLNEMKFMRICEIGVVCQFYYVMEIDDLSKIWFPMFFMFFYPKFWVFLTFFGMIFLTQRWFYLFSSKIYIFLQPKPLFKVFFILKLNFQRFL